MSSKLDALVSKVQKEHGQKAFRRASEDYGAIPRISTGIFQLDRALGGGIPVGRVTMVYGKKSAGKSALLAKAVANAQKMCRKCYQKALFEEQEVQIKVKEVETGTGKIITVPKMVRKQVPIDCVNKCRAVIEGEESSKKEWPGSMKVVWVDAEGTFDVPFYTKFGVDCDEVWLVVSDYGESAVDIADSAIRTGECDVLIVDSIAHLVPMKEREASAEDVQMALQARLVNKAMRVWTGSLNELSNQGKSDCAILLVNQLRVKVGLFPTDIRPGGVGQEYATSVDIKLWQKKLQPDVENRPLWQTTEFVIEKNKTAAPKIPGEYRMCLTDHPGRLQGDTWDDLAVFEEAKANRLIVKKDKKYHCLEKEYADEEDIAIELAKKGEMFQVLRARLLELLVSRPSTGELPKKKKSDEEG